MSKAELTETHRDKTMATGGVTPLQPLHLKGNRMRCIITYKRGPFSGTLDIGVSSEKDVRVQEEIAKLGNVEIISVKFW